MAKKGFFGEFKEFINKGSAIDMAVGIIVGSAMTGVVNSLVKDVIMPPIGLLIGGVDFSNWFIVLRPLDQIVDVAEAAVGLADVAPVVSYPTIEAAHAAGVATLNIGVFLNSVVSFFITMFAIFLFVKAANRFRTKQPAAPTTRACPYCKTQIDMSATKCPNCCSNVTPVKPPKTVEIKKKSGFKIVSKIKKVSK